MQDAPSPVKITLLNAKWLDPECHHGCQSLVLKNRIAKLEAALMRLRNCDWVITPADRMDAVREIARAALESPNQPDNAQGCKPPPTEQHAA